jgi:4'-phosphopantetheinyl transferase
MNILPASIIFERSEYGKPYIADAAAPCFNLSHAGDLVALAFCPDRTVGVDVEQWTDVEYDELSTRFFSPVEQQVLRALAPAQKAAGFFACWTRKEAYVKATGLGVSQGLDYFDVSLSTEVPAQLLIDRHTERSWRDWTMAALLMPQGYSGAVVVESLAGHTQQWMLTPEDVAL